MAKPERTGNEHVLPFGNLSPRDFERLCLWLLRAEGFDDVEHIGAAGSDEGCDLSATKDEKRWVCQCKRVKKFTPKEAEKEVEKILVWPKDERPDEILFLVTCDISAETRKRASKKAGSMRCTFWPLTDLDQRVKAHGNILDEFFQKPLPLTELILHQIPEPIADFVGREGEIEKLLAAFRAEGQGAVIMGARGMGGVGKTELAKVLAKRLKDDFPDAQIYFNLRGASDADSTKPATATEAVSYLIRSFHPDAQLPEDDDALQGIYHSVLEGKRVLLLMDNARDAAQLRPFKSPPDGCGLIVTSRHHFTLPGMIPVDVDTLPPDDAQELLLGICSRIGDEADALAKVCGYLPLALRLAASALQSRPTLGVATHIKELSAEKGRLARLDKYKELTDEERGIEASLAISYRLLDEDTQEFWRTLGVFPGDFDSEAAANVSPLSDGQDADTALGDLYVSSMIQWEEDTGRYRLHDLARDFARDRLTENEQAEAEQRHAQYYLLLLRRADHLYEEGGDSILQGLALFDREWGNIRTGQTWSAKRRETDETAAELCNDYPDAGAYCLHLRLHSLEHIIWLKAAVEAARSRKDRRGEGNHLGSLGTAYALLGEPRKAIEFLEKHLAIAQEVGDPRGEGNAFGNLGSAYFSLGEPRKAIEFYEKHLDIAQEVGDPHGEGSALGNLGAAYANLDEPRKAIKYYDQALVISRKLRDGNSEGKDLANLAIVLSKIGRGDEAVPHLERAVEIFEQVESSNAAQARALLEHIRKQQD